MEALHFADDRHENEAKSELPHNDKRGLKSLCPWHGFCSSETFMPISPQEEKGTVLVVDDSTEDRMLMYIALKSEGYHVLEATSGKEGLKVVKGYGGVIDLIVTDINMPGMSGVEFYRDVLTFSPQQKVIFISGQKPLSGPFAEESSPDFLEKSNDATRLIEKVREVLADRHTLVSVLHTN